MLRTTLLAAALLEANVAWAHHSGAMFDRAKIVTVTGAVELFLYANPHSEIDLAVPGADGKSTEWHFEGEAPSLLMRAGLHLHTLKPGDIVTVMAHPLRAGGQMGQLVSVRTADGKTYAPGGAGSLAPPPS